MHRKTLREIDELVLKAFPSPEELEREDIKMKRALKRAKMVDGGKKIRLPLNYGKVD